MLDQSLSMADPVPGGTKWTQITQSLSAFIDQAPATNFSLGLQYFGLPAKASPNSTTGFVDSCNVDDYARPEVEIGPPTAESRKALKDSMALHWPGSNTPTEPALRGALAYAKSWATDHPEAVTAIVLATDGEPYGCSSSTEGTAAAAAEGASGSPPVFTYVIGVGAGLASLAPIAEKGGTRAPILVDDSTDLRGGFNGALDHVRGAEALPCRYEIPHPDDGQKLDFSLVNVTFTPGSGAEMGRRLTLLRVVDSSVCDRAAGWYYDRADEPTEIRLCPTLCSEVNSQAHESRVDILVGCQTQQSEVR
jgi:hypothetical protein